MAGQGWVDTPRHGQPAPLRRRGCHSGERARARGKLAKVPCNSMSGKRLSRQPQSCSSGQLGDTAAVTRTPAATPAAAPLPQRSQAIGPLGQFSNEQQFLLVRATHLMHPVSPPPSFWHRASVIAGKQSVAPHTQTSDRTRNLSYHVTAQRRPLPSHVIHPHHDNPLVSPSAHSSAHLTPFHRLAAPPPVWPSTPTAPSQRYPSEFAPPLSAAIALAAVPPRRPAA